uniref:Uncharacterized protein n=1 Tax=Chlamydomonas euryale TaxID=1486919 RepID=A0A7R9VQN8_9CHLO|mmetsp:Transcript_42142/g.126143  ORF Transcript_42142/g.126143 Transcript_42142/m.126143 type:complete len:640 (+) Transcript_42142:656-2575(+)
MLAGNEFCERLAYYGLATNLVTYITVVIGGDAGFAAVMVAIFEGACYTTPLLGAVCADSMWGRYKTILVFSFVYLVGICLLTLSSWPPFGSVPGPDQKPDWLDYSMLCAALGVIALGTGGIKPNVSSFGADQFNPANPQDVKEKESFFNYFYMTINVGSLLACTLVVYVQDQISWTLGFAIPGFAMVASIIVFWMGRRVYVHVLPTESPMVRVYNVVSAALRNKMKKRHMPPPPPPPLADDAEAESCGDDGNGELKDRSNDALQADSATTSYRWLEDAITEWQSDRQARHRRVGGRPGYSPKQVEEVKLVLRLLPVFFCCILYWTIYTQMSAMFVTQGNNMHRSFEWNGQGFKIPAASMAVFNTVAIIALIWVYDVMLEPGLRALGYKMTMLRRCGWGMVIAALTMANAAGVEWWRLKVYREEFCTPCGNGHGHHGGDYGSGDCGCEPGTPSLSIFWQAPQYVLIGLSEVFTSIAQIEFFYDQAPDVMRSCSMALGLLSSALGSYMAGILTWVVQTFSQALTGSAWLPKDLNQGRLDLFFLLLMSLMISNTLIFVAVAIKYQYKQVVHMQVTSHRHEEFEAADVPPIRDRVPSIYHSAAMEIGRRGDIPDEDLDEEAMHLLARSLAYQPGSPAMPSRAR